MPWVGFEVTISVGEWPKTYALDRVATGTSTSFCTYCRNTKHDADCITQPTHVSFLVHHNKVLCTYTDCLIDIETNNKCSDVFIISVFNLLESEFYI